MLLLTILSIVTSLALLFCNAIYCTRKTIADIKGSNTAEAIWGLVALAGALTTLIILSWVTLGSLIHY